MGYSFRYSDIFSIEYFGKIEQMFSNHSNFYHRTFGARNTVTEHFRHGSLTIVSLLYAYRGTANIKNAEYRHFEHASHVLLRHNRSAKAFGSHCS